jgi:hypothetical protein
MVGWLALFALLSGLALGIAGQKWWSGFLVGVFDTLLALEVSNDWKLLKAKRGQK